MARNNPKPTEKPDWIPDDTTNIVAPSAGRKTSGWTYLIKPPAQVFNWFENLISRFVDYFSAQVEDWIVIDSDADEGDYATLAAYLADAPAAGDRVLIKEDQTVTAQTIIPSDITIKPLDGARVLCATNIASSVLQLNDNVIIEGVLNIVLSHTGTTAIAVEYNGDNATGKINVENSSTGTLTTAHHINANKTGNQVTGYVKNSSTGNIYNTLVDSSKEYADYNINYVVIDPIFEILPYDIMLARYDLKSYNGSPGTSPYGLAFNLDGTKLYAVDVTNQRVYQNTLSTPWDISTASYDTVSLDVSTQATNPYNISFKPDGAKLYVMDQFSQTIYQYGLSTPWDLSTASYDSKSFNVSTQETIPTSLDLKPDGTKLYVLGANNDTIYQYTLSTPWDISTASYDTVSYAESEDTAPTGMVFDSSGTKLHILGSANDTIYQYTLTTAWDITTIVYDGISFSVANQDATPRGLYIRANGGKAYIGGQITGYNYQYSIGMIKLK